MKPYIAKILEHDGKRHALPVPAKLRELQECVAALGLKDEADEEDMRVAGYKALLVPAPGVADSEHEVGLTAGRLAELTEPQVRAVAALCAAFGLTFLDIEAILLAINEAKGLLPE